MPKGYKETEPKIDKVCQVCGKPFKAYMEREKYCSKECRKIAERRKLTENKRLASIEKYKNTPGIAVCKECGFMGHDLFTHIKFAHGLTAEQYCKRWNCSTEELLSKQTHETRSLAQKNSTNPNKKRFSSENNPAKGHGGKFSPYSKEFIKYKNLSDEERQKEILKIAKQANQTKMDNDNCVFTKEYYIKHFGMSDEEAVKALSERQATFSLEKCIEKYGDEKGLERWKERQKDWQENFAKSNYSEISQKLFNSIEVLISCCKYHTYYATKGNKYNNEYILTLKNRVIRPDYFIKELKLIIEFDGEYWHKNEERRLYDRIKENDIKESGYYIINVREEDYKKNPQAEVKRCLDFIEEIRNKSCS